MKINTEWHLKHKMPKNPTRDQRIKWHLGHVRYCSCHPLDSRMIEEFKERFSGTHREFWIFFNKDDHRALVKWALECTRRVLPLFEANYPQDLRLRQALEVLQKWIDTENFNIGLIRKAALSVHASARAVGKTDPQAYFSARAVGQAVAAAHVPTHALGAATYAVKAVGTKPKDSGSGVSEREWQLYNLPENLRLWVITWLKIKEKLFK